MRNISDVGFGYVVCPLVYESAKLHRVIGPDINATYLNKQGNCVGITKELTDEQLRSTKLHCSDRLHAKKMWIESVK